jgi:predicted RNA-binding Zn-ribbon protein involved in translation (DUF1610 family)
MTSPPREIEVKCPKCGKVYADWYRPSINLRLDHFDDEYLEQASTSTCPECGYKVRHNVLTVRQDGVWEFEGEETATVTQPPSKIVKTFPPKGTLQQFRLEKLHEFECSRCRALKKSKLVVVEDGDWTKLLCNGCYGNTLSKEV